LSTPVARCAGSQGTVSELTATSGRAAGSLGSARPGHGLAGLYAQRRSSWWVSREHGALASTMLPEISLTPATMCRTTEATIAAVQGERFHRRGCLTAVRTRHAFASGRWGCPLNGDGLKHKFINKGLTARNSQRSDIRVMVCVSTSRIPGQGSSHLRRAPARTRSRFDISLNSAGRRVRYAAAAFQLC
jgi:hypothetical protein